jgi:hypothetical protein
MGRLTTRNGVRPSETRAEARSRVTDAASRVILDHEAEERERKTERLREARLAKGADPDKAEPKDGRQDSD